MPSKERDNNTFIIIQHKGVIFQLQAKISDQHLVKLKKNFHSSIQRFRDTYFAVESNINKKFIQ